MLGLLRFVPFALLSGVTTTLLASTLTTASTTDKVTASAPNWEPLLNNTHEYVLSNGLKVIAREDHRSPASIFQIWYRVGGSYEPLNQTGVSHMLEHMMFKGSNKIAPGRLSELIADFGGESNAATSRDTTYYYQLWSAQYLPLSFALEADRMQHLTLPAEEFDKEHQVVLEERRMRTEDNPQAKAYEQFQAVAYTASPYRNPVIGWPDDLAQLNREATKAWYQQWYAPNNATIVVVGDVDPETMHQLANQYFGDIPAKSLPHVAPPIDVAPLGQKTTQINLPAKLPWLMMSFAVPGIKSPTEPWKVYALYMLANVLDGGLSTRFEKNLVRKQNAAAEISVGYDVFTRGDSQFMIHASPTANTTITTLTTAIWKELKAIQEQPPTAAELAKVKSQMITELVYQQDSIAHQAEQIGELESLGLSWKVFIDSFAALEKITPEQVQAVAKEFLTEQRLTIGELRPTTLATTTTTKTAQKPSTKTPSINSKAVD